MKKFLHVIMFVLLSVTVLQITSVQAADDRPKVDYGSVEFGKELSVSADQDGLDGFITVTAPKDGFYSVRVKPESTQYQTVSAGIYQNNEEVTPYAEDLRASDNTKLRYYELKKGEEVTVKLGARSTARICFWRCVDRPIFSQWKLYQILSVYTSNKWKIQF